VPLVAADLAQLLAQARVAHELEPDVVEWRADFFADLSASALVEAAHQLRSVLERRAILFTLRVDHEGGKAAISQASRAACIDAVVRSGAIDLLDLELSNEPEFLTRVIDAARAANVRVVMSFHDFDKTPGNDFLLGKIAAMVEQGADIAKIACMPQEAGDVLRLLQVTLTARGQFPDVPLCTMSMGRLGSLSRVAGFLYGSDMAFAVAQEVSAPGQIPIREARAIAESLIQYV
jgi:3-dehydroquinate dehydratase I